MNVSSTKSFEQCYNGQAIVDDSSQVFVAAGLSQHANDVEEVEPILDILEENLVGIPQNTAITNDVGYFSETNVMLFEDAALNPFMARKKSNMSSADPGAYSKRYDAQGPDEKKTFHEKRPRDLLQKKFNR